MFKELYEPGVFKEKYFPNLVNRFSNASLGVEGVEGSYADTMQAMNIYQQTQAIEYAFSIPKDQMLNVGIIKEIEKIITGDEIENFRTTQAEVVGSKVRRTKPNMIYMEIYTLLDNYYNIWKDLDPFLREAYFHIKFLHIHPFEDGNGRNARILLIRNLCANGQVPCVITKDVKDEYCSYIENNDAEGLAKFFKKISKKEMNTMINMYRSLNEKGLIKENLFTERQEKEYARLTNSKIKNEYKSQALRDVNNLIKLFKATSIKDNNYDNLEIAGLYKMQQIIDPINNDKIVYYEDSRIMVIYLSNSDKVFKIYQEGTELIYIINDSVVLQEEFDYYLKNVDVKTK